jgi:hypothetical protein
VRREDADHADDRRARLQRVRRRAAHRRIRFAKERSPGVWLWQVQVHIPGPPFGTATSLDDAKRHFRTTWLAFKAKHGPEKLAAAYHAMNIRN